MREAAAGALAPGAEDPRDLLQYAAATGTRGFRVALAAFLTRELGYEVPLNTLAATNGNSHALELAAAQLAAPLHRRIAQTTGTAPAAVEVAAAAATPAAVTQTNAIWVEDPTYFLAHRIFRDHNLRLLPVPQRPGGGLDLDALETLMAEAAARAARGGDAAPRLLYTVPSYNNPTGASLTARERARLVTLCWEHGVTVLSDDVYQLLGWGAGDADSDGGRNAAPPPPLRRVARELGHPSTVVSLGTFSKVGLVQVC